MESFGRGLHVVKEYLNNKADDQSIGYWEDASEVRNENIHEAT